MRLSHLSFIAIALVTIAVGGLSAPNFVRAAPGGKRLPAAAPQAPAETKVAIAKSLTSTVAFNVDCLVTATAIRASSGVGAQDYHSVYCQNENDAPVTLGGSGVVKTVGPRICKDSTTCVRADFPADVRGMYCIADTTTTTLRCIASGAS